MLDVAMTFPEQFFLPGKGVPRNYPLALQWFSRSAANGNSLGQNNLGGMYRDGRGVPAGGALRLPVHVRAAQRDRRRGVAGQRGRGSLGHSVRRG